MITIPKSIGIVAVLSSLLLTNAFSLPNYSLNPFRKETYVHSYHALNEMVQLPKSSTIDDMCVDQIQTTINEFKPQMTKQVNINGLIIPPLAPFTQDHVDLDVNAPDYGVITGTMDNIVISGLETFILIETKCQVIRQNINITFYVPQVDVTGQYDIQGEAMAMFPVFGKGDFTATVYDVFARVHVKFNGLQMNLRKMDVDVEISKSDAYFQNLMGENEKIFNQVLSELGPDAVQELWPQMEPKIMPDLVKKINDALKAKTTQVLINLIRQAPVDAMTGVNILGSNFINTLTRKYKD